MASKRDLLYITVGNLSPDVTDTIRNSGGSVVDLTNCTVRFRMRKYNESTLKVDAPAVIDSPATAGNVTYEWTAADVNNAGDYRAWWRVTFVNGDTQDSPEFKIIFDTHADGFGTSLGEISRQTRQLMPITWDALSKDARYGDLMLETRTNYVKYLLFSTIVSSSYESTAYNPIIQDYTAKLVAMQIIPAGIDYWMNQASDRSTSGTSESVSYPDRIAALEKLQNWLTKEVIKLGPIVSSDIQSRNIASVPRVSPVFDDWRTPNPEEFPKQSDVSSTTRNILWFDPS